MSRKFEEVKEKYLQEKKYYDRCFLEENEEKVIKNMSIKSRKEYVRDNNIYQDTDHISETYNKYYRIRFWDITNEEFALIVQIESAKRLTKIHSILNFFLVMYIISVVIFMLNYYLY